MSVVLDASVGIKWFLPENLSTEAHILFEKESIFEVPDLFFIEIDAILSKRVRIGELKANKAREIASVVRDISFLTTEYKALNNVALGIATAYYISLYDAVYLTLAVIKDTKMITADQKLVRAVEGSPLEPYVMSLENVKP